MIENLHFLNQNWIWPVLIGGTLVWLIFLWKENPKKLDTRFFVNSLVALIAIVALAFIVLKPVAQGKLETTAAVLLTNAYAQKRLDSLKRMNNKMKVIPYVTNTDIRSTLDSVAPIFVLGDGVRPFDLWQYENVSAEYLGAHVPNGIIALKYDRKITVGKTLVVRGRLSPPKSGHYLVLATSGGMGLDSVILKTSVHADFELSTEMKVEGSYNFSLIEKDTTGIPILSEPLPITVVPRNPLKVLLINSFPTFESKYLKNYLAESGHELTVRSLLTKGNYKFEYFNTVAKPIYDFSRKRLESYDLLIIDPDSYVHISSTYKKVLKAAMEQDGLGVFVQPDQSYFSAARGTFSFDFVNDPNTETRLEHWPNLQMELYPFRFKPVFGLETIYGEKDKIIAAYRRAEKGRIGTTTLQNTYKWILNGHTKSYQEFWSEIIGSLSKRTEVSSVWSSNEELPYRNNPYTFTLRTIFKSPEVLNTDGDEIPMQQQLNIPELWTGIDYPINTGWNELRLRNDSTSVHRFFVLDSTNYTALHRYKIQLANNRFFDDSRATTEKRMVLTEMPNLWFFIIFMIAVGWLWLSPKISRK